MLYYSTREKAIERSRDVCGPLTQRLVSALVDNRIHVYHCQKNGNEELQPSNGDSTLFSNKPNLATALGLDIGGSPNSGQSADQKLEEKTLEGRLRKVLVEQGFLSPASNSSNPTEDVNDPLFIDIDEELTNYKIKSNFMIILHGFIQGERQSRTCTRREQIKLSSQ